MTKFKSRTSVGLSQVLGCHWDLLKSQQGNSSSRITRVKYPMKAAPLLPTRLAAGSYHRKLPVLESYHGNFVAIRGIAGIHNDNLQWRQSWQLSFFLLELPTIPAVSSRYLASLYASMASSASNTSPTSTTSSIVMVKFEMKASTGVCTYSENKHVELVETF